MPTSYCYYIVVLGAHHVVHRRTRPTARPHNNERVHIAYDIVRVRTCRNLENVQNGFCHS